MDEYFCDFNQDHILINPKLLPCGSTACEKCIEKLEDEEEEVKKIQCPYCKTEHLTKNLPKNLKVENLMRKNIVLITDNLVRSFQDLLLNCQGIIFLRFKLSLILKIFFYCC
jgi:hypothetical protein